MTQNIGIVGLGRMGAAMAERLLECGFPLVGWNRTRIRAEAVSGLTVADTPSEVADQSDIIIVMLLDEIASDHAYRHEGGLLKADLNGKIMIDMSTLKPEDMAALSEAVRARGGRFLAAPVGGSIGPARNGNLLGLIGGDAETVAGARTVLNALCDRLELFETPQAAAAMKLAINLPLLAAFQALGESALIARRYAVSPERLLAIVGQSPGAAPAIALRAAAITSEMNGTKASTIGFSLEAAEKDLRLIDEIGQSEGFDLPLTEAVRRLAHDAVREGWGERDLAALAAFNLRA